MNLDFLNDQELLNHLRNYSTDPVVLRLVKLAESQAQFNSTLFDIGFDDNLTIEGRSVAEHINFLNNEIDYLSSENEELSGEVQRLSTRTVIDLIIEIEEKNQSLLYQVDRTNRELDRTTEDLNKTKEQLKSWNYLRKSA